MRAGGLKRSGRAAANRAYRDRLQAADTKYRAGADPLEIEVGLRRIEPTNAQQLADMTKMLDKLYGGPTATYQQKQAFELWKFQVASGSVNDQVKFQFLRRFYYWLLGRGEDQDVDKTMWGRANAAVLNPEVAAYIDQFVDKRTDYAAKLSMLSMRVPETLNGYYLYFKYIVNGRLKRVQDPKNKEYTFWDMSEEDYLEDFDMFRQEFDPKTKSSYAEIIQPQAEGKPQKKFEGQVPFPATLEGIAARKQAKWNLNAKIAQAAALAALNANVVNPGGPPGGGPPGGPGGHPPGGPGGHPPGGGPFNGGNPPPANIPPGPDPPGEGGGADGPVVRPGENYGNNADNPADQAERQRAMVAFAKDEARMRNAALAKAQAERQPENVVQKAAREDMLERNKQKAALERNKNKNWEEMAAENAAQEARKAREDAEAIGKTPDVAPGDLAAAKDASLRTAAKEASAVPQDVPVARVDEPAPKAPTKTAAGPDQAPPKTPAVKTPRGIPPPALSSSGSTDERREVIQQKLKDVRAKRASLENEAEVEDRRGTIFREHRSPTLPRAQTPFMEPSAAGSTKENEESSANLRDLLKQKVQQKRRESLDFMNSPPGAKASEEQKQQELRRVAVEDALKDKDVPLSPIQFEMFADALDLNDAEIEAAFARYQFQDNSESYQEKAREVAKRMVEHEQAAPPATKISHAEFNKRIAEAEQFHEDTKYMQNEAFDDWMKKINSLDYSKHGPTFKEDLIKAIRKSRDSATRWSNARKNTIIKALKKQFNIK